MHLRTLGSSTVSLRIAATLDSEILTQQGDWGVRGASGRYVEETSPQEFCSGAGAIISVRPLLLLGMILSGSLLCPLSQLSLWNQPIIADSSWL